MTINDFMETVFKKYQECMTDEIFHFIETDDELFHDYLKLIENNKLHVLNSSIARAIKKKYNLTSVKSGNTSVKSKLIKSHTSFSKTE